MKTDTFDSTRPSRSAVAAILAAAATLREMLSTADLAKVIDLPSDTEKQNKIEAIELEAMSRSANLDLDRVARARQVARGDRSPSCPNRDWSAFEARHSSFCKVYKPSPELHDPSRPGTFAWVQAHRRRGSERVTREAPPRQSAESGHQQRGACQRIEMRILTRRTACSCHSVAGP